jgi:hypothetical protein
MSALGIWLWSNPRTFGAAGSANCAADFASFAVLGRHVPFGSNVLRIISLTIYSLFLVPGVNLLLPMGLFLSVYFWHRKRLLSTPPAADPDGDDASSPQKQLIELAKSIFARVVYSPGLPVYVGLAFLLVINVVFIADIELTLRKNAYLQEGQSETEWGFGQILAMLLVFMPLRDLIESILARRQKRHESEIRRQEQHSLLKEAIRAGDVDQMVDLVKQGVDPNTTTEGERIQSVRVSQRHRDPED